MLGCSETTRRGARIGSRRIFAIGIGAARPKILNYFTHPVTQGFVEGKSNLAKVLERRAFGYRNVDNVRVQLQLAN